MHIRIHRAIADPTFAKGGELPLESYISPTREWAIFVIFFSIVPTQYITLINTSIASVVTHERIAKIRVPERSILKFLWDY